MQEKNQSRGSLGIGASKPQGESAQSCFFSALFLAKTFAEVLFSPKICCTRTFDPSISLQDLFWQFFTLTTPLNICRPYICSEPVCFVSLLHKTQTHLAQAGPWPSWPRTSARGGSLGVWTFHTSFMTNETNISITVPYHISSEEIQTLYICQLHDQSFESKNFTQTKWDQIFTISVNITKNYSFCVTWG